MDTHARIRALLPHAEYLPPDERRELDAHVATCPECATVWAALHQPSAPPPALPAAPVLAPPPPSQSRGIVEPAPPDVPRPHPPFPWPRLLIPAGFILLFVLGIWLGGRDTGRRPPPPSPTVPAPAPTTIVFACDDVNAVYRDYAETAAAFTRENPGIKVELKSYRDLLSNVRETGSYTDIMQEVAANADAFCIWDVASLVAANLLYNLDPLIARDSTFQPSDFYEAVYGTVLDEGKVYAVPSRFQPALLRYDPTAFAAAGVPEPRTGWTWDDFLTAAIALTRREKGDTVRWGFGEDSGLLFSARFRAALDNPAFLAAASSDQPLLDPSVVDLFRWYERLYVDARAAVLPRNYEWSGGNFEPVYIDPDQISEGKMAMWTDLMYPSGRRQGKPAPFPIAVADGAGPDDNGSAPIYTNPAWSMAADTLHPDAVWRWLNYLSHHPPRDANDLRLPARRSLVEKAAFWDALPPDEIPVYRYILDHLAAPIHEPLDPRVQALYDELRQMVAGKLTLVELLARPLGATSLSAAQRSATVTLRFAAPRADLPAYVNAANAFEQARGIHVELLALEDMSDASQPESAVLWTAMRSVARRADVLAGPGVANLARSGRSAGILHDLTPLVSSLPVEDFYPNTLASLQWGDRTWAVPARVRPYLILYNRWMFDQMAVPYPQLGWSWDDFAKIADAVTSRGGDNLFWFGFKDGPSAGPTLLQSRLGPLVTYGPDAAPIGFDAARAAEALQWYAALVRRGALLMPGAEDAGDPLQLAAPENAAMWVSQMELPVLPVLGDGQIGAVPFPVAPGADGANPFEITDAYAISAFSGQSEAAWSWIEYLLKQDPGDAAARPGVSVRPALAALAEGDKDAMSLFRAALEHARRLEPLRPEVYLVTQQLTAALKRIVDGQPASAVVQEARDELQKQHILFRWSAD